MIMSTPVQTALFSSVAVRELLDGHKKHDELLTRTFYRLSHVQTLL